MLRTQAALDQTAPRRTQSQGDDILHTAIYNVNSLSMDDRLSELINELDEIQLANMRISTDEAILRSRHVL